MGSTADNTVALGEYVDATELGHLRVNAGALGHALGPSMLGRFDVDGVANGWSSNFDVAELGQALGPTMIGRSDVKSTHLKSKKFRKYFI